MRTKFWNCWSLVHELPSVEYVDSEEKATVSYAGITKILAVSFQTDRDPKCLPDRLLVRDFAARFPRGRKVWDSAVQFSRDQGSTVWEFDQVYIFHGPHSLEPANIIGFLEDYSPQERGVGGLSRDYVRDRARAHAPDGPKNASEVGRWWPKRSPPKN